MICAEDELDFLMTTVELWFWMKKYKVGEPFAKYFSLTNDEVYEIGLTPNRTDAMSHYGVARDLNAFLSNNGLKSEFEK
jgi:phenylalanyl-tRNA synthetase beta chain